MISRLIATSAAIVAAMCLAAVAHAQDTNPTARMAQTIVQVCLAAMRSGEALTLEQFGDQFEFDEIENGVTWLQHARGQPWIRLAINAARPGSCGANFSSAGRNSFQTAAGVAAQLRNLEGMRSVSVPGIRQALTFDDTEQPFDHERHAYIAYINVAGYQSFFFTPPPPTAAQ